MLGPAAAGKRIANQIILFVIFRSSRSAWAVVSWQGFPGALLIDSTSAGERARLWQTCACRGYLNSRDD